MKTLRNIFITFALILFMAMEIYCLIMGFDYGDKGDYVKGTYYGVGAVYAAVALFAIRYDHHRDEKKEKEKKKE